MLKATNPNSEAVNFFFVDFFANACPFFPSLFCLPQNSRSKDELQQWCPCRRGVVHLAHLPFVQTFNISPATVGNPATYGTSAHLFATIPLVFNRKTRFYFSSIHALRGILVYDRFPVLQVGQSRRFDKSGLLNLNMLFLNRLDSF